MDANLRIFVAIFLTFFLQRALRVFYPLWAYQMNISLFSQKMLALAFLLFLLALTLRYHSQKSRLWVPTLFGFSMGYLPVLMYALSMEGTIGGGGVCGRPELLEIGNVIITCFTILAFYEFIHAARLGRNNK